MEGTRYQSIGPVQVAQVDVPNINLALAQVQEQLDQIRGLRGVTRVYNRLQVDDPQAADEALTAGAGAAAISGAVDPIQAQLDVLAGTVAALETEVAALGTQVTGQESRLTALEGHLAAIVAAVPAVVSVATVPALAGDPATAILLENDLTANWRPPVNSNDAALASMANALREALLAT